MKKEKQISSFRIGYYFKKHKGKIALYLVPAFLGYAASMIAIFLIADVLTQVSAYEIDKAIWTLIQWFIILSFARICMCFSNFMYFNALSAVDLDMKRDISARMFQLTSNSYQSMPVGLFVSRITKDPITIIDEMDNLIMHITDLIYYALIIGYIFTINIWAALVLVVGVGGIVLIEFVRRKLQNKQEPEFKKADEKSTSLITEIVRSEKDIKSLKMEDKLTSEINLSLTDTVNKRKRYRRTMVISYDILRMFVLCNSFALMLLSLFVFDAGLLSLAMFMFIFTNKDSLSNFGFALANMGRNITSMKVANNRIKEVFNTEKFTIENFGENSIVDCRGKIEFKNVSFSYEKFDEENNSEKQLFKNLSFTIEPHTTVAFVGKSGSGKTTIMNLISKINLVDGGKILIDGCDINSLSKESLRDNVTMVNQFPYIYDASIKENLLMAKNDATDEELENVLKSASLYDFVNELPEKINTQVGESGVKLSGGQKQRLAIARALLRDSKIILFDESTSALDNFAQKDIQKSIESLSGERTVVIVAHRLSTIKNAQKIFFIKDGKINGEGTFEELFEGNAEFKQMFLVENI